MADNTRKTSNIIHDLAEVKEDVSNNSQNIQNNTDAIGNISIPSVGDGEINLEAGDGLTLSAGNENAKANQDGNTTFKIEANLTYLNDNLNIPVGGVSKIVAGDNVTVSPSNGTGDVTINAVSKVPSNIVETLNNLSGNLTLESSDNNIVVDEDGTDKINLTLNASLSDLSDVGDQTPADDQILTWNDGTKKWEPAASQSGGVTTLAALDDTNVSTPEDGQTLVWNNSDSKWENKAASGGGIPEAPEDGKQYGREDGTWTEVTSSTPVVPGDGKITLKSTNNTVSITGQNATANQTGDTAWDLSVNIPTPVTPGDGKIDLTGGTGIDVTGDNATANQTGNTAWSVAIDSTVALKSDIPVIPSPVVPGDGEIKLTGGTGIDIAGANGTANQVGDSDQTISIDSTVALKADIHLPIADEDDTVKIWSAANDFINFDTGGTNDFKMDPDGNFTANGKIISKSVGISDIAFSNDDDDGFAFILKDFPGIVSNGEQVQNYNYSSLPENPSGETYQRYQSTIKARKGATSYSELMFLSDDPTNLGIRFVSCGMDVTDVLGWPETCGYDSSGASAILYTGYEFSEGSRSGEYSPLVVGSINNADVCFIQNSYPFITLDANQNDIDLHVPLHSAEVKNNLLVQGEIQTDRIVGKAVDTDAAIEFGTELLTSRHTPTQPNSIATVSFVESLVGSGGNVESDTVPGTGATARWPEQTIVVPLEIDGVAQTFQQVYGNLYAYDGIFTDGLHWTSDGYAWYTSDPSDNISPFANATSGIYKDRGRVLKGLGNEYLASEHISNDMKSWREITGVYGDGPVFLGGEIYSNNGRGILDRANDRWVSTGTYFGGDLTSSPHITNASQESGLYSMTVVPSDGTAYWNAAIEDSYPSEYTKIDAIADGDGALDCLFSERLQKWMVVGEDKFWITNVSNLAVATWTQMDLPTASNWNRIVDDGGTISLFNTADNANLVLYCVEPSGPATTSDWNTTVGIDNRGYEGFAGTNGRTIASMYNVYSDDDSGDRISTFYYALSGDLRVDLNTSTLPLTNPVDKSDTFEVGREEAATVTRLETQEDANIWFDQKLASQGQRITDLNDYVGTDVIPPITSNQQAIEANERAIATKATVVVLSQAEYDALQPEEIDAQTLYLIT